MQVPFNQGFTLLELIITIAIIGIISTWAIPSYQDHIRAVNRSDAKSALLKVHLEQEKWRASHVSYATLNELKIADATTNNHYFLSIKNQPDSEQFLVIATPKGAQQDDPCGTFALNQLGAVFENYADQNCWGE